MNLERLSRGMRVGVLLALIGGGAAAEDGGKISPPLTRVAKLLLDRSTPVPGILSWAMSEICPQSSDLEIGSTGVVCRSYQWPKVPDITKVTKGELKEIGFTVTLVSPQIWPGGPPIYVLTGSKGEVVHGMQLSDAIRSVIDSRPRVDDDDNPLAKLL